MQHTTAPFILALSLYITTASCLFAEELPPIWEFGVGVGGLSLSHYRGSDQTKEYISPVPYLSYRGKRLEVDREGARFYFIKKDNFRLDVSTSFNFPVESKDNRARQGMTDLDPIIEFGPRAQFRLYTSEDNNLSVHAAFPVRTAIATDLKKTNNQGWIFSPYLQLSYYSDWETSLSIGPSWSTEKYHDYYYQVDPAYATMSRPAYDAQAGYSGFRYTLITSTHFYNKRLWFGALVRYDTLSGAVFEDSPLVKQTDARFVGIIVAWVFKASPTYGVD